MLEMLVLISACRSGRQVSLIFTIPVVDALVCGDSIVTLLRGCILGAVCGMSPSSLARDSAQKSLLGTISTADACDQAT